MIFITYQAIKHLVNKKITSLKAQSEIPQTFDNPKKYIRSLCIQYDNDYNLTLLSACTLSCL